MLYQTEYKDTRKDGIACPRFFIVVIRSDKDAILSDKSAI
jgi:hypothetical protein